jgi:2-methylisocitrate lyase-like PEP mutase family enzyme
MKSEQELPVDKDELRKKAEAFRKLHHEPRAFVLPNAWDIGSAVVFAEVGFPAIATTSAGVAVAQGYPDGERISREEMLAVAGRVAAKVSVPVSADLEAGYGTRPEEVAETVRRAIAAGLVGANFEDGTRDAERPLRELSENVERIRAAREAADSEAIPFVINARTDAFLVPGHDPKAAFEDAVRRANAYRAAGADCLFVPGRLDLEAMARLAEALDGPLNVLGAFSGYEAPPVRDMERAGVRRVSIGGSLSLAVLAMAKRAAEEMKSEGTFSYAKDALTNAQLNKLLGR